MTVTKPTPAYPVENNFRVLVADDESSIRELYRSVLTGEHGSAISGEINELEEIVGLEQPQKSEEESLPFEVEIVDQGEQAVKCCREGLESGRPFAVAFLDIRMPPGIDGVETARRLRELDEKIYIVFVTAYSDHSIDEINRSTDYSSILLRKPFHKEDIQQLAQTLCRKWDKERRLESMLIQVEQDAREESRETRNDFFSSMNQELRSPLSTIIAHSEKLLGEELDSDKREILHAIAAAGRSQLAMVNDIFDLTKIEHGNFSINVKPYNLDQLIDNIVFIFAEQTRNAGLQFEVNREVKPEFKLIGDMQRINQILINLLGNAIKFTAEGTITLSVWSSTEQLYFSVRDTGTGISKGKQASIFNMFVHSDDQGKEEKYNNCGLRLYISMTLARLMEGALEVESAPGQGSTFTLSLPWQESSIPVLQSTTAVSKRRVADLEGEVLVVDDLPSACMLLRKLLEQMGLRVTTVNSGNEAIDRVDEEPRRYSLILMDLQMPGINGIETAHLLRNRNHEMPIILISADYNDRYNDLIHQGIINDFLEKPTHRIALYDAFSQFLAHKRDATPIPEEESDPLTPAMKELFRNELIENHRELSAAFKHQAWEKMRAIVHDLKGSGSAYGLPEMSRVSGELCDAIDNGEQDRIIGLTIRLVSEIRNALNGS